MDKEQFKQKLSEVADWQIPKLNDTEIKESLKAIRGRGRPSEEEQYQWEHMKQFLEIHNGTNPTSPLELTKVKIAACVCTDCGKLCENGCKKEIKYYPATRGHVAHRRIRCITCGFYRDPNTGQFDLPQGPACQQYLNWAKKQFLLKIRLAKQDPDK
jgi:hypothetical protein